jgi:cell division protein FtsN
MNTKILRELIEKNTRVILPEFGAFLVKDDGTGVFKAQNVTFSPFLRFNDGMVEDFLSSSQKISKDRAKELLVSFISEMRNEIQSKKIFIINGLGSLQVDNRGSIHFSTDWTSPDEGKKIEAEGKVEVEEKVEVEGKVEGKVEVEVEEKGEVEVEKKVEKKVEVEGKGEDLSVEKSIVAPKEDIPKIAEVPKDNSVTNEQKKEVNSKIVGKPIVPPKITHTPRPKHKLTPTPQKKSDTKSEGTGKAILYGSMIGLGFVILMVAGWYLYKSGVFTSNKQPHSTTLVSNEINNDTAVVKGNEKNVENQFGKEFDELSSKMDKSKPKTTQNETKKSEVSNTVIKPRPKEDDKIKVSYIQENLFHIIAGSFRNNEYANNFSKDLRNNGYKSKVIVQPSGLYSVTLGSFLTREVAVDSMNQWKRQYPNIWILKQ